jgi:hypothetical protein
MPVPEASPTAPGHLAASEPASESREPAVSDASTGKPVEIGGPPGPEPTRYGDWEKRGRCIDF